MVRKVLHVVRNDLSNQWFIKEAGIGFPLASANLKENAVKTAVNLAKSMQPSQVKIHGLDGKIQTEWTYKNDPRRYLG
ncbi:MAG: DUF2188 domain-containing protein [bacterium]|nr:DUF2188 domain-containing protein [bacterium]